MANMFDFSKFYDKVADELPDNCRCVEVGVAFGQSALYLANRLYSLGKKFHLYMVDNCDYGQYDQLVQIYENIIKSGLGEYITVIPKDSLTACNMFNDNSLDFVYLDSGHTFDLTVAEIANWYGRLKDFSYLSGHDYSSIENPGVKKAVDKMLPKVITRPPINKLDQHQIFEPEVFLQTMPTEENNGVWYCVKNWYWQPKL